MDVLSPDIGDSDNQIWRKRPDENGLWYGRFLMYLEMGDKRRFLGVYNAVREDNGKPKSKGVPESWNKKIKQYEWKARAEAWTAGMQEKIRDNIEDRLIIIQERKLKLAEDFYNKANTMLQAPLFEKTIEEDPDTGQEITVIKPVGWTLRDSLAFASAFSDYSQAALDMDMKELHRTAQRNQLSAGEDEVVAEEAMGWLKDVIESVDKEKPNDNGNGTDIGGSSKASED